MTLLKPYPQAAPARTLGFDHCIETTAQAWRTLVDGCDMYQQHDMPSCRVDEYRNNGVRLLRSYCHATTIVTYHIQDINA